MKREELLVERITYITKIALGEELNNMLGIEVDKYFNEAILQASIKAAKVGMKFADEHPRWISVEDELPPQNEAYLAYWLHLGVGRYRFVKANEKVGKRFKEHITHWMPLPQSPLVTDLNKKDLPPLSCQEGNILVEEEGGEE